MKKVIALYLPQYHTIPENDEWWGKGFTEWTNTRKSKPLYKGHYQPREPYNDNYYDLSDVTVMEKQAELAKKYGVYGFCYYHYWFKDGKKLLEKPIENMLQDKNVDIPFCLCWANENWARTWDGGNKEILIRQDYGDVDDWDEHFKYLIQFFKDDRYIKINNKPVMLMYKPELMDKAAEMRAYWEEKCIIEGFDGLIFIRQNPESLYDLNYDDSFIDYSVKFEPISSRLYELKKETKYTALKRIENNKILMSFYRLYLYFKPKKIHILDYDHAWDVILNQEEFNDESLINGAFVDWDNSPRKKNGMCYKGASPEKFEKYFSELLKKPTGLNFIFINAWNEWGEGAYLEPDKKYGYAYLEALKNALKKGGKDMALK